MPDIAGNTSTTTSILVGGTVNDVLEVTGDHDWIRIELVAGQKITITLDGVTLEDPYLYLRSSTGALLDENDDISSGVVRDSRLVFTATTTGTYYIDVGAYNEAYAGTYQLTVQNYAPPPVASYDEIAQHLTSGYWGGDTHAFNVSQGGTITVNLTALTAAGQNLAREALALWSDVIGVTFLEVSSPTAQIIFDDNEEGAFADASWSNGVTTSARVNVSTQWLVNSGTSLTSYSFQTYVHEIGHALGLGHGGYYNGDAVFDNDALFLNDSWASTIMSYFDQDESSYYDGLGFTRTFAVTPMLADIRAMADLYGLSTTTRTGDTTYGFGNTSGRSSFNAFQGIIPNAQTIFDSAGIDTLNYSGFENDQRIDLNQEAYSNVGGGIGNVTIAFGTVIENATGGSGADTIIGNSANNVLIGNIGNDNLNGNAGADILTGGFGADNLTGGLGDDTFRDTRANLSGDTITDFSTGDRILFTDATLASFSFSLTGNTLTYTGGSLTLTGVTGTLVAAAAAGGGVQITIQAGPIRDVANDFNGDGRSDILWRNVDGTLSNWLGQANGGFVANNANAAVFVPTAWSVVGTGDFNGDGRDDILWRNTDGTVSNWLGQANGGFVANDANAAVVVPIAWSVVGTGDFNGDGRDDILWRNVDGTVTDWLGNANGGFTPNDANAARFVPTEWHVVGTGDFNGDGREDVLWRNENGQLSDWLGQANGGFMLNDAVALTSVSTDWFVAGVGDFNGDGRDDILWRNNDGQLSNWLGQANGGFVPNNANAAGFVPTAWTIVSVGDYNGDGRDDILWRNADGTLSNWLGTASGGFVANDANAAVFVPTSWQVQPEEFIL
jgi:Ca2+-binding RTX toxin-like protein